MKETCHNIFYGAKDPKHVIENYMGSAWYLHLLSKKYQTWEDVKMSSTFLKHLRSLFLHLVLLTLRAHCSSAGGKCWVKEPLEVCVQMWSSCAHAAGLCLTWKRNHSALSICQIFLGFSWPNQALWRGAWKGAGDSLHHSALTWAAKAATTPGDFLLFSSRSHSSCEKHTGQYFPHIFTLLAIPSTTSTQMVKQELQNMRKDLSHF